MKNSEQTQCGVNCISLFDTAVGEGGWRLRPSSVSVYRSMWRRFEQTAKVLSVPLAAPTPSQLEELVLAAYPDSTNTSNKLFRVALKVYEHAGPAGELGLAAARAIEHRFFDKVLVPRTAFEPPSALTGAKSAAGWKRLRTAAMLSLVAEAAPRTGELRALRYQDVRKTPSGFVVLVGRGGSRREIQAAQDTACAHALARFLACHPAPVRDAAFFCASPSGDALNAATLYRQVKAHTASHGVSPEHHGTGAFRAALAQRMLQRGRSLEDIRKALGHRVTSSTEEFIKQLSAQPPEKAP